MPLVCVKQVVLKIIKHCRESLPTFVAGCVLGLGMENTLEVTNCFPFPSDSEDPSAGISGQEYLMEMLKAMRDVRCVSGMDCVWCTVLTAVVDCGMCGSMLRAFQVNVDHQQVGWYQSTYMGQYCTHELIATQFEYQENLGDNAVVILYDPLRTSHGSFSLKAYRLTDKFMGLYRVEKFLLPKYVGVVAGSARVMRAV